MSEPTPMFGLIAQVTLSDKNNVDRPYVFRFSEGEQFGYYDFGKQGDEDKYTYKNVRAGNNGRIKFHTTTSGIRNALKTCKVDLYNLNERTWNWILQHGGGWGKEFVDSRLYLKLEVGWFGFGNPSHLETIFNGSVHSFYTERQGTDNIFHFFCSNMPPAKQQDVSASTQVTPQSVIELPSGTAVEEVAKALFTNYLAESGFAADMLKMNFKPTAKFLWQMYRAGIFKLEINFPSLNNLNDQQKSQVQETIKNWKNKLITKVPCTEGRAYNVLKSFCLSENTILGDMPLFDGVYGGGLLTFTGINNFETKETKTVRFANVINPVFSFNLTLGKLTKLPVNTKVPSQNIIVNYEMLTQDPRPTQEGIQLNSLMRPWLNVDDFIMLKIITDEKEARKANVNNINYGRPEFAYTANMSSLASEYSMTTWGNSSVQSALTATLLNEKKYTTSFLNVPLQIGEIQHIGDTHGKVWHSLITTRQPGLKYGG